MLDVPPKNRRTKECKLHCQFERNKFEAAETFDNADAVHDGRVVSFVDEVRPSYRLDAKRRLTEVHFAPSVVEVERRELVASQAAADTDRQTAEETQFIGDGDRRSLGVDGAYGADLVADRVDVHWAVQQPPVL